MLILHIIWKIRQIFDQITAFSLLIFVEWLYVPVCVYVW
jgi:hypothetical protein